MRTELRCQQCRRRHYVSQVLSATPRTASPHIVAMIGASISMLYRRMAWFFNNMSRVATQNRHRLSFKGFNKLKCEAELEASGRRKSDNNYKQIRPILLPVSRKRKTIFLDLDETLVHASPDLGPTGYDFIVRPIINGQRTKFYVLKRPGLEEFLGEMSKKYEVVVFTAALKEYAKLVVDRLDPRGELISHRLYRDACGVVEGRLVKDLSRTGREAGDVVIIDDNPNSYALQPENAIPISRFICEGGDRDLERVMGFLGKCDPSEDMRDVVKRYLNQTINSF